MDNPIESARSALERSRSAVHNAGFLFRLPAGASRSQVRRAGVKTWLAGMACVVVCSVALPALEQLGLAGEAPMLILLPELVALYLMMVGAYRVILGRSPEEAGRSSPYELDWRRLLAAIGVALLSIAMMFGVLLPAAWIAEKLFKH